MNYKKPKKMGVVSGVGNYHWLFLGTFIATLLIQPVYGSIVSRFTRRIFLPYIYTFFALVILSFWNSFHLFGEVPILARSFFIFISVYNVFIVSLFWSFMANVYNKEQGRRLFESINLIFVSFICMFLVVLCLFFVRKNAIDSTENKEAPMGGSAIEGFKMIMKSSLLKQITVMTIMATLLGSFLYTFQGVYVSQYIEPGNSQAKIFNQINLVTNLLAMFFQMILIPFLLHKSQIP